MNEFKFSKSHPFYKPKNAFERAERELLKGEQRFVNKVHPVKHKIEIPITMVNGELHIEDAHKLTSRRVLTN